MTEDELLSVPREFLNAAVLIDDELFWGEPSEKEAVELVAPGEFDVGDDTEKASKPSQKADSPIDAEKVVDGFSELGLVCATYRWTEGHSTFPNSSDKADLIILDWKLDDNEDVGTTAIKFLNDRLTQDLAGKRRLRYIVVYTDKPMAGVIGKLSDELDVPDGISLIANGNSVEVKEDNGPSLWRILYQSKTDTPENALARSVLKDFALFLDGLLPRAVMSGVAELRNRTFEHLYRFNRTVDPAVASHLLAKRSSELEFAAAADSFPEFVVGLIVNDFSDALYGSDLLRTSASTAAVNNRMSSSENIMLKRANLETSATPAQLEALLAETNYETFLATVQEVFKLTEAKAKKAFSGGHTPMQFASVEDDHYAELANIDLMSNYPKEFAGQFQLKSGVIVRIEGDGEQAPRYLICIQPVCDAVRLPSDDNLPTKFPFIELQVVEPSKKFTFVVKVGDDFVYLLTKHKVAELTMGSFVANAETGDVRTVGEGTERAFVSADGLQYRWVSELKEIYAIELQTNLSSQASRIGSNKFEWLRAKSG